MNFKSCDSPLTTLMPATKALSNFIVSLALVSEPCDLQIGKSMRSWNPPVLSRGSLSVQVRCS